MAHFTEQVLVIVAFSSKKLPIYTKKNEQDEISGDKFYPKELIKVLQQWIRLQQTWFPLHLCNICETILSVLKKTFLPEPLNLGRQWNVTISEMFYQSENQNNTEEKFVLFD